MESIYQVLSSFKFYLSTCRLFFSRSWLTYFLFGGFIIGWWAIAFRPMPSPPILNLEISQSLALKTSALLEELSPLQREVLQKALAGHFPLILDFIDQWEQDAVLLTSQGIEGIQHLPVETYLKAHILGHLLKNSSSERLRQINCKMNVEQIWDDRGHLVRIEDHFKRFLPQTYLAATFLLAIAHPSEILALPKGLRHLKHIYSPAFLEQIPTDIDQLNSESLYLNPPDLAFVAPYSHPPALEVLRHQNIQLYSLNSINTVEEVQEALLKVGHASNHILEAQLLAIFMEAGFLAIDNRLQALHAKNKLSENRYRFLYLSHRHHYELPTSKCLTGQLMIRALKHCPHLIGMIPDSKIEWAIPFEQEQILQAAPDILLISSSHLSSFRLDPSLHQTEAFKTQRIFYIDEMIQASPTQHTVLAYFDLFQALASIYCL